LTFDKKSIDEVCWAPNNQIIFSSNKGGNTNLWMIPSGGGTEVQITKGTGPDLGMKISADSKKLLYYQNQITSDLWIGSLRTGIAQQVTFDDRVKFQPALSPDGNSIAFVTRISDPLKTSSFIVVTNRDGNNRRQITSNEEIAVQPKWSPDGRWIAYTVVRVDSAGYIKSYITDIGRPGAPKFVGNGQALFWLDPQHLVLVVPSPYKTMIASAETGEVKPFFEDSTIAFPLSGGKFVFYRDLRRGREGRWVVEVNASFVPKGTPRKILGPGDALISPRSDFLIYQKSPGELLRVSLLSGKEERIPNSFPGFSFGAAPSLNPDTKEIIYAQIRSQGKLVMIENLFK
jgi:dipeptidyl aminopeptidase/acylaminoacyl peptidase